MPKKKEKEKHKVKSKAQHLNWTAPYQPGSNMHIFHKLMCRRGGLPVREFHRKIKELGASAMFILRVMRGGISKKGWTWDFDDSGNRYRITNVKRQKIGG